MTCLSPRRQCHIMALGYLTWISWYLQHKYPKYIPLIFILSKYLEQILLVLMVISKSFNKTRYRNYISGYNICPKLILIMKININDIVLQPLHQLLVRRSISPLLTFLLLLNPFIEETKWEPHSVSNTDVFGYRQQYWY